MREDEDYFQRIEQRYCKSLLEKAKENITRSLSLRGVEMSQVPLHKMDLLIEKEIGSLKVKAMLEEQEEQAELEIKNKI